VTATIVDFAFQPATITIRAGDTIVWNQAGDVNHTVTSRSGGFDSGTMSTGDTYSRTFTSAGTINYVCVFHGQMQGRIVVEG
jgi:plastocyanin